MRADRLLSLLLLLQNRGKLSARELAAELEVSERTVYRDVDALCAAGVPVCAEAGRDGGFSLVESYRTNLTGLTEGEVRALFMLSIPAALAQLGLGREIRSALLKLSASLPRSRQSEETWVRQRFYLDTSPWPQGEEATPHLRTLHDAVRENRRVLIRYHRAPGVDVEQHVDPYGLVAKAGAWYLVCAREGKIAVQRVSGLADVTSSTEPFERPAEFDLPAFWETWCAERGRSESDYRVLVRVAPGFVRVLPHYFGEGIRQQIVAAAADEEGRVTLELHFESLERARERLLDFGRGVEVIAPIALRKSVLDSASQTVALYTRETRIRRSLL